MVESGQRRWLETAHTIMNLYRENGEQAATAIENLLEPEPESPLSCPPKAASTP
jgi:hypothetical protein